MPINAVRDTLYLLAPGFEDNNRREYCPECAEIWGVLAYYPAIKESLNVIYMPIEKPRQIMVEALGADFQNCPTLVLSPDSPIFAAAPHEISQDKRIFPSAKAIGVYWAHRFGTAFPRGSAL